jgi:hypothetical protein
LLLDDEDAGNDAGEIDDIDANAAAPVVDSVLTLKLPDCNATIADDANVMDDDKYEFARAFAACFTGSLICFDDDALDDAAGADRADGDAADAAVATDAANDDALDDAAGADRADGDAADAAVAADAADDDALDDAAGADADEEELPDATQSLQKPST